MTSVWIIGRKATIASNGHSYIAEPFLAFPNEAEADEACDMIERVSGERPMKAEASFSRRRQLREAMGSKGGVARAEALSPARRKAIAKAAAEKRWGPKR